jgi:hypothetical protein
MTTAEQIRMRVKALPLGEPFTTASLLELGTRATVDQTLHRLARSGHITSVSRGVYVRPRTSRYVGSVMPEPYKVAEAIAHSTGATLQVHGAEAARQFGLSTQVPTQAVYLTTGPSRHLKMGKLEVTLKHTSPRKLALAGRPGLALAALRHLGKREVTSEVIEAIRRKLEPMEFETLRRATGLMPAWLSDQFHHYQRAFARA